MKYNNATICLHNICAWSFGISILSYVVNSRHFETEQQPVQYFVRRSAMPLYRIVKLCHTLSRNCDIIRQTECRAVDSELRRPARKHGDQKRTPLTRSRWRRARPPLQQPFSSALAALQQLTAVLEVDLGSLQQLRGNQLFLTLGNRTQIAPREPLPALQATMTYDTASDGQT